MAQDDDKKGQDNKGQDKSYDSGRAQEKHESPDDLHDYRNRHEEFDKSEGWITRPTTSETPTQTPTTQEGGKEE